MKKLKIYFDTSAISNLVQTSMPKEMDDMLKLWELIKNDVYDVVISEVVMNEIKAILDTQILNNIISYLEQINYETVVITDEIHTIAKSIIHHGILTQNSYIDCVHIACALSTNCNCLVSYNFKHLVKIRTINGVRAISNLHGYGYIDILTANTLI